MLLLCPACRTPLPGIGAGADTIVTCSHCSAEIDVSRASTAAGRPRFVPEIDRTGEDVGGYRLAARVGAGGMGTVYRAARSDVADALARPGPRDVAVKFLAPALAGDPDLVARFAREVKMLRALDNDAIVRVLDHGDAGGVPWYAMELVDGPDLKTRLVDGPLPPADLAAIFGRILDALAHAHERGIVHRDLKPGNVLLAAGGAKLADFGIARLDATAASAATRLTETAAIVGTFPYMSPEQRAGRNVDKRSDLFSIGVMLYEAATGRLPQGAFPPASQVNPAFGTKFDRVVARLLNPDPAARFPDAGAAGAALADAFRSSRRKVAAFVTAGAASFGAVILALLPPALTKFDMPGGVDHRVPPLQKAAAPNPPPAPPPVQGQAQAVSPLTQLGMPNPPTQANQQEVVFNDDRPVPTNATLPTAKQIKNAANNFGRAPKVAPAPQQKSEKPVASSDGKKAKPVGKGWIERNKAIGAKGGVDEFIDQGQQALPGEYAKSKLIPTAKK